MLYKKISILGLLLCIKLSAFSQNQFKINILDEDLKPISGASVGIDGVVKLISDERGEIIIKTKSPKVLLDVYMVGYHKYSALTDLSIQKSVVLKKSVFISEEIIVSATRIDPNNAGTSTLIDKQTIQRTNVGQDLPYLLNFTPSVVITSDAGNGIGYTGIRIRGTDQTRTNLTINGVPLNDAESQGTFTVNIPDFASSVENIQIQRGVGTSTNGAGAFGAAINIQTDQMPDTAYAEVNITHGAFDAKNLFHKNNSEKYTAKVNTGLIDGHWNFSGRLSKISSQGYIDNSNAMLKSFFTSASYRSNKHILKFNVFSGLEKTNLAWNGVPEDSLTTNRTYNPISEQYEDQYDNYQQDHYQIFETFKLNSNNIFNIGYHFTRGRGFFQEFRYDETLLNYKIDTSFIGNDTITNSDILRRRWLRNDFEGLIYSWEYTNNKNLKIILGGAANRYDGEHFGEIIWARFAENIEPNTRYYTGWGNKDEINTYIKINYTLNEKINAYVDVQHRAIKYAITGTTKDLINVDLKNNFNFINPKAGVSFNPSNKASLYLSFGVANKEPNRDDFINGFVNGIEPKSERLYNTEIGWKNRIQNFQYEVVGYLMNYENQLVLTGEVNNVGEYLRVNTPKSHRAGVEVSASWFYSNNLKISANVALSENKIKSFDEYLYNYDVNFNSLGTVIVKHENTDIAFSPNFISSGNIRYKLIDNLFFSWDSKIVGRQYLDNTSNVDRKLDAFYVNDLSLDYNLSIKNYIPLVTFIFKVNNVFNTLYEPNGYTYSYLVNGVENRFNFYYPQAGRNYLFSMNFRF